MSTHRPALLLSSTTILGFVLGFAGCGGGGGSDDGTCQPGTYFCACFNGVCQVGLLCSNGFCINPSTGETGGDGDGDDGGGDGDSGDGDGDSGDGDGDSGDGDGDDGDGDGDPMCDPHPLSYTPPKVMLLVDASGSMVNNVWDHDNNVNTGAVTRWYSLVNAVDVTADSYDAITDIGVQRFPSESACDPDPCYNITSCTVENTPEAGVASNNGPTILSAIPSANATSTQIEGGTPTGAAFVSAVNHLNNLGGGGSRYVVLITDGAANCNTNLPFPDFVETYDETLAPTIADAYQNDGIPTFVIGIDIVNQLLGSGTDGAPEANPYVRLNEVAIAGGVPNAGVEKFYNSSDQGELESALDEVFNSLGCSVDLSESPGVLPEPAQIPLVTVESNGAEVPFVNSCAGQNGWTWDVEGESLSLCGTYCDAFASGASVVVDYGC